MGWKSLPGKSEDRERQGGDQVPGDIKKEQKSGMWRGWGWREEQSEAERKENWRGRLTGTEGCPRPQACCAGILASEAHLIISTPRAKGKTSGWEDVLAKT